MKENDTSGGNSDEIEIQEGRSLISPEHGLFDILPLSRREFLTDSAAIGAGLAATGLLTGVAVEAQPNQIADSGTSEVSVMLQINGKHVTMLIEPRVTLLDAIRNHAALTGTKMGCDHGQCGACTVHIDGRRALSCLTLAIMHQGQEITTIEGLAAGNSLHPMSLS